MVKRQIEGMLHAFEACNKHMSYLDNKYKFSDEEREELYKFQYQLKNLSKNLKEMKGSYS